MEIFTEKFYKQYREGKTPANALQAACDLDDPEQIDRFA